MTIPMKFTDAEREASIQECQSKLANEELSSDAKREIWQSMRDLINERSPEQVANMEKERGLDSESSG